MIARGALGWLLGACLAAALLAPPAAVAENCDPGGFRIGDARNALWARNGGPKTIEEINALNEAARLQELGSRARIVNCVSDHLRSEGLTPAKPSGTPAHAPGSSGVLTDIDDAYDSMTSAKAAAQRFEKMGYNVEWPTANSFSVPDLDYVGFSMEEPHFPPGSVEEESALRRALRNEDNVKSVGGQEWVKGKVQPKARIDELKAEQQKLQDRLGKGELGGQSEDALRRQMAKNQDEIADLTRKVDNFRNPDLPGFNADMVKKGAHHMDPADWCPPQVRFDCYEQPRQGAKAAQRALAETIDNPTPEQRALMDRLEDYAKKRRVFSSDPAAAAREADALRADMRSAFSQANKQAAKAAEALDRELIAAHRAARNAGDAEALKEVEERLAMRREAARRNQMTMEELLKNDAHVKDPQKLIHEWTKGERLQRVDVPGKPPVYQVIEEAADGSTRVVRTVTEAEIQRTARNAIRRNMARSVNPGLPAEIRPSFSSVQDMKPGGLRGLRDAAAAAADSKAPTLSQFTRAQGALGMLGIGYAAYSGAERAVGIVDRHTDLDPDSWTGYGATVALGTVIGVADVVGLTLAETAHAIGGGIYGLARRRELENAQKDGREASKLGVLGNLNVPALMDQFIRESAESIADWARQTAIDVDAAHRAELEAIRAELAARGVEDALWARLLDGGFEQVMGKVGRLRALTDRLRQMWRTGTGLIDRSVLGRDDMLLAMAGTEPVPDLSGQCEGLLASLGPSPTAEAIAAARLQWSDALSPYREKVRQAAIKVLETRAAAASAEQLLGDGAGLPQVQAEQAALQSEMQGRLGRLITVVGNDALLVDMRDEVASYANPIPYDMAGGMLDAAREIRAEAEQAVQKLHQLDTAAIPPCPFPDPDALARIAAATAEGKASLASCDFEDMRVKLAALEGAVGEATSLTDESTEVLAALRREVQADDAFKSARESYFSANLGNFPDALSRTEAQLNAAKASACPERLEKIDGRMKKVSALREALASVGAVLQSCDLGQMQQMSARLEKYSHPGVKAAREQLDGGAGSLGSAIKANDESKPAYLAGQLGKSESRLNAATAALDDVGAGACPELRSTIAGRLDKIQRLRTLLSQADRAKRACDKNAMRGFIAKAESQKHRLLQAKVQELRAALESCDDEPAVAEEPPGDETENQMAATRRCQGEFGTHAFAAQKAGVFHCVCDGKPCRPQTAAQPETNRGQTGGGSAGGGGGSGGGGQSDPRITGQMVCAAAYEGGIVLGTTASGGFRCGCPSDRYLDEGRGACLTWNQVVAAAEQGCRQEGGTLAKVSGPGNYACCPAGSPRYDEQTDSCWGRDDMVADARAQCARDGLIPAQINGPNDYVCCPRGTTRYDAASNRCIDENQARRDAQQAAQALQGLGQMLQGLNQQQGGSGYSCANPPPGCHCRPGTSQFHCGNESGGGTTSNACGPFQSQANQHAARMQRLVQQYQALGRSNNRAALQAKACEMFREGKRGQQIISRAQASGCRIPPQATQYRGLFDQALAESC